MQNKSTENYKNKVKENSDNFDYYYNNFKTYFNYKQHCLKVFRLLELWKNRRE